MRVESIEYFLDLLLLKLQSSLYRLAAVTNIPSKPVHHVEMVTRQLLLFKSPAPLIYSDAFPINPFLVFCNSYLCRYFMVEAWSE